MTERARRDRMVAASSPRKYGGMLSLVGYGSGMLELRTFRPNSEVERKAREVREYDDKTCSGCGYFKCSCVVTTTKPAKSTKPYLGEKVAKYPGVCFTCGNDTTFDAKPSEFSRCSTCEGLTANDYRGLFLYQGAHGVSCLGHDHPLLETVHYPQHRKKDWRISKFRRGDKVRMRHGSGTIVGAKYDKFGTRPGARWIYIIENLSGVRVQLSEDTVRKRT